MLANQRNTKRRTAGNWFTAGAMGAGLLVGSALASGPAQAVTTGDQDCRTWRRAS